MGKNAIISVFDKTNLDLIAKFLIKKKYTIYSTGSPVLAREPNKSTTKQMTTTEAFVCVLYLI